MATVDASTPVSSGPEPKRLYRIVEPSYADLSALEPGEFFRRAAERTLERFGADCGILTFGLAVRGERGWKPLSGRDTSLLACVEALSAEERARFHAERVAFADGPVPAALWLLGTRAEWLVIFLLAEPLDEGRALLLQTARLAVQQKALETGWTGILDRARAIQRSLLPDPLPELPGFDLSARSDAADVVGGDVYDAIRLSDAAIGLMIADASGHGLPAALETRDVVVGLRMGAARQLKIEATIERLNRILCASTLSSRFVSLVYGELDAHGAFDYVNAGHPPPLVLTRDGAHRLPESGRVLGVSPGSVYRVGHAEIPPDGTLLLYTDGVTECPSPSGEEFGVERLAGIAQVLADAPAAHLVSAIFDGLTEHACRERMPDDATVFVVKRRG
jgi:serine phosphatase RsbU (regulator of sigma subunit)